ncbi:MAG TPA: NAD(P)-dependent oxidoreductase [Hyphomicrobiaceae bacterium]|jgi:3-hydroxyisobutyrate dehydrogenase-like beta-hydroxyacid dehydrogenase|nr:NAD(P)-dependent oxidoreductase [Hyphomicrobiaceae bacterium]
MTAPKLIGIVGLGLMGSALAERLIGAGYAVLGFDIDAEKRRALGSMGGKSAASLAEVARRCDILFLAVFDIDQVEAVTGELLAAVGPGSGRIVLCASTCDPDRIAALAARVALQGLHFLDTPVSGTSAQVRQGRGVAFVGGDAVRLAEAAPILAAVFPSHFHMGPPGSAGRAKLAINLILGLNRLALAEGLVFAERLGLEPSRFLEVARQAASYSQVMDTKGPKMVRGDFTPEGRARQTLKDVELMLAQARRLGQELPLAQLNAEVLRACVDSGEGDQDNSVVINEIRRRVGPGRS